MTVLLLALALGAPAQAQRDVDLPPPAACSVRVLSVDARGRVLSTRTVSSRRTQAMVFQGRTAQAAEGDPPLVFDVFNPRGRRYQVLLGGAPAGSRAVVARSRSLVLRPPVEARLAVAGSSIAWTSMFGQWRVEPRFEGQDDPCGPPQTFTILP